MKRTGFLLLMLMTAATLLGQQAPDQSAGQGTAQTPPAQAPSSLQQSVQEPLPPPPPQAHVAASNLTNRAQVPSDRDINCAGFIASEGIPENEVVRAGWDTPHQTRFTQPQFIYIKGTGFQEGGRYFVVRKLKDPNRWEAFKGQHRAISAVGQPYADIGIVQVIKGGVRGAYAIAQTQYTCDTIVPGDYALPYAERERPPLKYTGELDPFLPPNGKTTGKILLSRDFQDFVGTGEEVYLDIGADKGVKVGDYFHVTRDYKSLTEDPVDSLSFKARFSEETQANQVKFPKSEMTELPRRTLGEMIILNVHPKSATGMITSSLETLKIGDNVEWFEPPPPPPPPAPPASTAPTISCTASPDTVHKGESSTVTCEAASPDNHPITIAFNTSAGAVSPRDNTAVLDTAQIEAPATATVTGTVNDDRNQSASSAATVNVQPAAAAPAPTSQQIVFRPRSSYVDNKAKAILDGVALQLQQQADATAVVIGRSDKGEPASLAARRADNVKKYLTASKGIDPKRIDTKTSPTPGKLAEVWVVPAGAQVPADAGTTPAPAAPAAPVHHRTAAKKPAAKAPAKPAPKPQH